MRISRFLLALTVVLVISVPAAFSQSLVELAKREKERRAKILKKEDVLTITNRELNVITKGQSGTTGPTPAPKPGAGAPQAQQGQPRRQLGVYLDDKGRNEDYWKRSLGDANKKIADIEAELKQMGDLNAKLVSDQTNVDDPGQQMQARADRLENLDKIGRKQDELRQAKQDRQNLMEEARRSGALPGWLR